MVPSKNDSRNLQLYLTPVIMNYTYQLPSDKKMKAVLHGVFTELDASMLNKSWKIQGFHSSVVTRMRRCDKLRIPLSLVLVKLPQSEKSIYNVRNLGYFTELRNL
jgi:hypothetical protein